MPKSTITIEVELSEDKVPQNISWSATASNQAAMQNAKGLLLALWDGAEKSALRIDLWTKDMMVDEMADFYYQTFMTMADTYNRATHQQELVNDIKKFAADFYEKFRKLEEDKNKK